MVMNIPEPVMTLETSAPPHDRRLLCGVGGSELCLRHAMGAASAATVADLTVGSETTFGVLPLCERHWTTPPSEWGRNA